MQDAADGGMPRQDVYPDFETYKGAGRGAPNPVLKLDNRDGQRPITVSAIDFLEHFRDTSTNMFKYEDMLVNRR